MASVSSLDKDLRNLRLGKYTPQIANEIREWIEETLGEKLPPGDLLEVLKDGIALCKLVNLATGPPGVRSKPSSMPFVQMENISHFLRACQASPLNLPPHDVFLTVDLYEAKDPAQVVQCIGAFSRRANMIQPDKFPRVMGTKSKEPMSPQTTGTSNGGYSGGGGATYGRARAPSNTSEGSTSTFNSPRDAGGIAGQSRASSTATSKYNANGGPRSPTGGISSWSSKNDEGKTTPAWNIHQYGYMGGASQGNQGITFGGRRQITTPGPKIPSLAEKERKRRAEAEEADKLRLLAEEAEYKRRVEREAEEERDRIAEEKRWEEETRRQREQEKREAENEKRRWEEEERKWKEEEEMRMREEKEAEARFEQGRQQKRSESNAQLEGQFLSQYQSEQRQLPKSPSSEDPERVAERERVKDLERQLEEAKERERRYEQERQDRLQSDPLDRKDQIPSAVHSERQFRTPSHSHKDSVDSWQADERESLRHEWSSLQDKPEDTSHSAAPPQPPRPLPTPQSSNFPPPSSTQEHTPSLPSRPLPDPTTYTSTSKPFSRTIPSAPNPQPPLRETISPLTIPQTKSKPAKPASSLLEREMERERQRQQEWEEAQKATKEAAERGVKDGGIGPGESWDVNQYGYMGGDNQNRVGPGLGGRRQILGPRPKP